MRKKLKPLPEPRALVHATCLSQLGELKFFFRKNWSSWEGYSTVEGGGEGFVTLLAESSFCMSCNRLAMFCKEMYERVASPG